MNVPNIHRPGEGLWVHTSITFGSLAFYTTFIPPITARRQKHRKIPKCAEKCQKGSQDLKKRQKASSLRHIWIVTNRAEIKGIITHDESVYSLTQLKVLEIDPHIQFQNDTSDIDIPYPISVSTKCFMNLKQITINLF